MASNDTHSHNLLANFRHVLAVGKSSYFVQLLQIQVFDANTQELKHIKYEWVRIPSVSEADLQYEPAEPSPYLQ